MDLRIFGSVLWRFKYVVAAGVAVALLLSILTVARIDFGRGAPFLASRTAPIYASSSTLLITQYGFPWGSAVQQYTSPTNGSPVPAGDIGRLTSLANLYVQLANSDTIRSIAARRAPYGGGISATQNYSFTPTFSSIALPIITLSGTGRSPNTARATAQAGVDALTEYLDRQQQAAGIAIRQRVVVQELQRPRRSARVNPPKKTLPIVVFLTVMLAVIGLVVVLENLRPRPREAVVLQPGREPLAEDSRRTA